MHQNALEPRPQTYQLLGQTRNPAAVPALAAGLLSPSMHVRAKCVELLLGRNEPAARRAIIVEWTRLDSSTRELVSNFRIDFENTCKDVLAGGSRPHKQAVINAICDLDMTAALPELIGLALDEKNQARDAALAAVFELCDRWGQRARKGKDIPSVRTPMLETMSRAVYNFPTHRNYDLIDAWLLLVCWEDASQRSLVSDPMHPAFRPVLERLSSSDHNSILQLLGGYVWRSSTPRSILSVICERTERELPLMIAESVDDNTMTAVVRRLRELPPLASLGSLSTQPSGLDPKIHRRLWLMLAANSPSIEPVLAGAVAFYRSGTDQGHRMAAEIVRTCRRVDVEALIQFMQIYDSNPSDTASAGAHLHTMLSWIGGTLSGLDAAAREFFSGFTIMLLMDVTRKWPAPLCRVLARVISRAEPEAVPQLLKALDSPAPKRRLLALQVIQMLDVTSEINERLLPLVDDSRAEVRVRAIDILSALGSPELTAMLPGLLQDPTTDVQDAARRAQRRSQRKRRPIATPVSLDASSALVTSKARS